MRADLRKILVCFALTVAMICLVPPVVVPQDELGSINVLVYDSRGSPLRSTLVSVFGPVDELGVGSGASDIVGNCETDSLGQCTIQSVKAGRWSVLVTSYAGVISEIPLGQAYGTARQLVIVSGGKQTSAEFRMFPEAVIRGRVLTQNGKTVQGAYLDAEPDRLEGVPTAAESDELGNYVIRSLITASYDVRARHPGSQEWTYRFGVPAVSGEILDGVDIVLGVSETWTSSDTSVMTSSARQTVTSVIHEFGAYAIAPVQIDSQVGPGEWTMADSIQLRLDLGGVNYDVTLSIMNDLQSLYLLATVKGPPDFTGGSVVAYWFDNTNKGYRMTGDDWLTMNRNWPFEDGFWNSTANNNPHDTDYGGTKDGAAAISFAGGVEIFEISHPLCSNDHTHDFCLRPGATLGFFMSLWIDTGQYAYWPGYDEFARISVASSSGTVVTTQATSAGRTAIEPVPESSSSSRSIVWGVLIGLFVSAPISIYRHWTWRRRK